MTVIFDDSIIRHYILSDRCFQPRAFFSRFMCNGIDAERLRYIPGKRFTLFFVIRYFSARGGTTPSEHVSHPLAFPGDLERRLKSHALSSRRGFSDSRSSGVNFLLPADIWTSCLLFATGRAFRPQYRKSVPTPFVPFLVPLR